MRVVGRSQRHTKMLANLLNTLEENLVELIIGDKLREGRRERRNDLNIYNSGLITCIDIHVLYTVQLRLLTPI